MLTAAPSGISWSTIPAGNSVTNEQRLAEQSNICARATAMADQAAKQPLRATTDTLLLYGPGERVGVRCGEPTQLILKRWPILQVTSVRIARNTLPWTFTPVPATDYQIAYPVAGMYGSAAPAAAGEGGQTVLLKEGWIRWDRGHRAYVAEVAHVNGWPQCGLTATADASASALQVDDCTGWAVTSAFGSVTGATGVVYDPMAQEVVHVTAASAASGPGTLTLAAPLQYEHAAGTIVSTLPANTGWAVIMFAIGQALTRGATATTVHQIPGGPGGKSPGPDDWYKCARAELSDYARII